MRRWSELGELLIFDISYYGVTLVFVLPRRAYHWWKAEPFFGSVTVLALLLLAFFIGPVLDLAVAARSCGLMVSKGGDGCSINTDGPSFKVLSSVIILIAGLFTLAFAHRRSKAMADNAKSMARQIEMGRRDQLSKRFTEAVKQLGDDTLAIRMGGDFWALGDGDGE